MLAESTQMIFSTAQKTGTVHLHNTAKDTPLDLRGACGSSIARPNLYRGNAWALFGPRSVVPTLQG